MSFGVNRVSPHIAKLRQRAATRYKRALAGPDPMPRDRRRERLFAEARRREAIYSPVHIPLTPGDRRRNYDLYRKSLNPTVFDALNRTRLRMDWERERSTVPETENVMGENPLVDQTFRRQAEMAEIDARHVAAQERLTGYLRRVSRIADVKARLDALGGAPAIAPGALAGIADDILERARPATPEPAVVRSFLSAEAQRTWRIVRPLAAAARTVEPTNRFAAHRSGSRAVDSAELDGANPLSQFSDPAVLAHPLLLRHKERLAAAGHWGNDGATLSTALSQTLGAEASEAAIDIAVDAAKSAEDKVAAVAARAAKKEAASRAAWWRVFERLETRKGHSRRKRARVVPLSNAVALLEGGCHQESKERQTISPMTL